MLCGLLIKNTLYAHTHALMVQKRANWADMLQSERKALMESGYEAQSLVECFLRGLGQPITRNVCAMIVAQLLEHMGETHPALFLHVLQKQDMLPFVFMLENRPGATLPVHDIQRLLRACLTVLANEVKDQAIPSDALRCLDLLVASRKADHFLRSEPGIRDEVMWRLLEFVGGLGMLRFVEVVHTLRDEKGVPVMAKYVQALVNRIGKCSILDYS